MPTLLVVLVLLGVSVAGVYLLLKSMGQNGIEAAAPGSCKSGRCGVQSCTDQSAPLVQEQYVQIDETKRHQQQAINQ